jgi:tetratricopeptide (TPR) repeat protein
MPANLKNIKEIQREFNGLKHSDAREVIKFFEENFESIESLDISKTDEEYKTKLKILCDYGVCLVVVGNYSKGAKILNNSIPMYEYAPDQEYSKLQGNGYFENLLWSYGLALSETKQINDSIKIFKRLVEYYPDNEKYRKWLNQLKANKISKITTPLWIICMVWLFGELTFFEQFESTIKFRLALVGFILLLIVTSIEYYKYLIKKKKSTNA